MSQSWLSGALKSFFGVRTDTKHWNAVKLLMEDTLGDIRISCPREGEKVSVFFVKQTLVGDKTLTRSNLYKEQRPNTTLNMAEAVGTGKNLECAIMDLWENLTRLKPHESIMQMQNYTYNSGERGVYNNHTFGNGSFTDHGQVITECPPPRPYFIEANLAAKKTIMRETETPSALGGIAHRPY